jgi:acyl carrier protein
VALHPEDSLRDDLGLDSLQTIELVYQVESVFDLQIPDEDFGRLRTIGDVVTYLLERIGSTHNHVSPPHVSTMAKKPRTNSTIKTKPRSRSKTSPP